uniref:C2 domain-containing protein n=1 Tax=Haplochromis burtoni TaxID=8153 RepID=A0A3Q2V3T9_HAPBU
MDSSAPLLLLLLMCSSIMVEAELKVYDLRVRNLPFLTDSYVKASCAGQSMGQTSISRDTNNPWWEEELYSSTAQADHKLTLTVMDSDVIFDDKLGSCTTTLASGTHDKICDENGWILYYSYTVK